MAPVFGVAFGLVLPLVLSDRDVAPPLQNWVQQTQQLQMTNEKGISIDRYHNFTSSLD